MNAIPHLALAATLHALGLMVPTSVRGVYGQHGLFADLTLAISAAVRAATSDGMERMRFASAMPRADLERIGYFRNFPHLLGTVHCFCGDERAHRGLVARHDAGEDWTGGQEASDVVLIPAACYPLYAVVAARGPVPDAGVRIRTEANCFRHEPSEDPARLQSFHMHEVVMIGRPADVVAFRDDWLTRGKALLERWGLEGEIGPADDPFFGRAAVVMAKSQRAQELKYELRLPVSDPDRPTACLSANYHLDSFGRAFGLKLQDDTLAHSACVGWGVERIALALLQRNGPVIEDWPRTVRDALAL